MQHYTGPVTPIPGTPNRLDGIISVSGDLLPLLNLSAPSPEQNTDRLTTLIICQLSNQRYGVLVSRCAGRFSAHAVKPSKTTIPELLRAHVTGVVQVNNIICPLLDLMTLYTDQDTA